MNNGYISLNNPEPIVSSEFLNQEEARVTRIVEAIREIKATKAWSTLKSELFDSFVNITEKDLKSEARKEDADVRVLARLSGKLEWAEKFADFSKLESQYMIQLKNISKQIHGKTD